MEVSFYARLSALSSHRPRRGTLSSIRLRFMPACLSVSPTLRARARARARVCVCVCVLPFSPVMASVHIIVDGENANRENAEYAV
jgi:hypothetical protein